MDTADAVTGLDAAPDAGRRADAQPCAAKSGGFCALVAGGGAAGLAAWGLPAVFVLPLLPLTCLSFLPRRSPTSLLSCLPAVCWCWMLFCVVFSWRGPLFYASATLLAIGFMFDFPTLRGLLRCRGGFMTSGVSAACAAACAALLLPAVLSAAFGPWGFDFRLFLPATALAGCSAAWPFFRVLGEAGHLNKRLSAAARIGTALALSLWLVRLAGPAIDSFGILNAARAGDIAEAIRLSTRAAAGFKRLKMKRQAVSALRAKAGAELLAGRRPSAKETFVEVLRLDPNDRDARMRLLEIAAADNDAATAYRFFSREAGFVPSPIAIKAAAAGAVAAADWNFLARLADGPAGNDMADYLDEVALWPVARRAFFSGYKDAAGRLLAASIERGGRGWEAARLLFWLRFRGDDAACAGLILEKPHDNEDAAEKAYFHSMAAGLSGGIEDERDWLRLAIESNPAFCAAARRLSVLEQGKVQPRNGKGVVFDGSAELLSAVVENAEISPGGHIRVAFEWEISAPFDPDRRVFLHFRRRVYGGSMFQADHSLPPGPESDSLPVGCCVKYAVDAKVPDNAAAGIYAVYAGLWDGYAGRRVGISRADSSFLGGTRKKDSLLIGRIRVVAGD